MPNKNKPLLQPLNAALKAALHGRPLNCLVHKGVSYNFLWLVVNRGQCISPRKFGEIAKLLGMPSSKINKAVKQHFKLLGDNVLETLNKVEE